MDSKEIDDMDCKQLKSILCNCVYTSICYVTPQMHLCINFMCSYVLRYIVNSLFHFHLQM